MMRIALILGLLLSMAIPATGQSGDLQRQIAEKQRAIEALEKQIARGEQELSSIKKGKNSEQQSVQRLSRQIASRRQLLDETESQLSLLAEQLAVSDSTAGALNIRLERSRAEYATMVREAYRNHKQNSYLTYIFAAKDFADVARRIANIRGVAKLREAKMREIAETAENIKMTELVYLIVSHDECCLRSKILGNIDTAKENFEQLMYDHIFDDVSIDELAALCNRSLTSFKKEFKRVFLMPPHQWFIRQRLMHARMLLISTSKSISQIGSECAFPNTSHFIKLFKKEYGMTPANYRSRHNAELKPAPEITVAKV